MGDYFTSVTWGQKDDGELDSYGIGTPVLCLRCFMLGLEITLGVKD
jgi:hypothetical protein